MYTNCILKFYNEYIVENNDSWAVDIKRELQYFGLGTMWDNVNLDTIQLRRECTTLKIKVYQGYQIRIINRYHYFQNLCPMLLFYDHGDKIYANQSIFSN